MSRPHHRWTPLALLALVGGAVLASLAAVPGSKVRILERGRVGGYAEDLAFVTTGPLANHIVMVQGFEVWGIASEASGRPPLRKLFDLYSLDPTPRSAGIAYVESRRLFAINDSTATNLFFVDHRGRLEGSARMTFPLPDGYAPGFIEGMGYVPPTAGQYPDHLVLAAFNSPGSGDLLFVDLAGNVVKHVKPGCSIEGGLPFGVTGVEYLPGDRLALVDFNAPRTLCVVDFDGVPVASAVLPETDLPSGEGVARLADGRIVVTGWPQSLLFFDADLNRLPGADRHDVVGAGLDMARGLAWDSTTDRHLISHTDYVAPGFPSPSAIAALPTDLKTATDVVDLTTWPGSTPPYYLQTQSLTYAAPEGRVGAAAPGRGPVAPDDPAVPPLPWFRGILLWDTATGELVDQIDLCVPSAPVLPSTCTNDYGSLQPSNEWGRALRVAYIPGATPADAMFAVRFNVPRGGPGGADLRTVYLFSRSGHPLGAIDFGAGAGVTNVIALEYFDPGDGSGGRFAVLGRTAASSTPQFVITDLAGQRIDGIDIRTELGLPGPTEVSVITTGPQAGAFAVYDSTAQELVVFRLK